jgi:uncharacterized protein (DUF2252 family)
MPAAGEAISLDARRAHGKAARSHAARSAHAEWLPQPDRRNPVEILAEQDATRLPELVPVRYGRMLDSPFSFYRGAAAIMAADLGALPSTRLRVQLCGDAHLANFGAFQAPDRRLVFDINDFDETLPGPFEWDVKRLAASFAVAGRACGFDERDREAATLAAVGSYRRGIRESSEMRELDIWYARLDLEDALRAWQASLSPGALKRFQKDLDKARHKDSLRALAKLTERRNGSIRIASRPPVLVPLGEMVSVAAEEEILRRMRGLMADYQATLDRHSRHLIERYRYADAGHKVVGVGSVGMRAWVVLLLGRDENDPLFLQLKEAQASVLEPFAGASRFRKHGHRVVAGQRLMQAAGDAFLGWISAEGLDGQQRDFYVRQLWDGKSSADVEAMDPRSMWIYAGLCGSTLARAHARSGDAVAIAGYLGKGETFDRSIAAFAESYADQNEADCAAVRAAVEACELEAQFGV